MINQPPTLPPPRFVIQPTRGWRVLDLRELWHYRELAAFAQLSTDLDKATKDQLTRGERMVEILKQDILAPMPFERQVLIIFAGNEGLLDDLGPNHLAVFETGLFDFIEKKYPDIEHEIRDKKTISDAIKTRLIEAIMRHKEAFLKTLDRGSSETPGQKPQSA